MSLLAARDVRKVFNEGRPDELVAVDGVSVDIEAGAITVLRGPSGSGKTTLLTLLGCMARPSAGRVALDGEDVSGLPERFLTDLRRRTFGFVFQQFHLVRGLSVLENVMLPAFPLGVPRRALVRRAEALLASLDLGHRARAPVDVISGGEAQRVAIARALVNGPRVIVADEPTAHLDSRLSRELMVILGRLRGEGKTVVVASHDAVVHDAPEVDRVISLRDGRLAEAAA